MEFLKTSLKILCVCFLLAIFIAFYREVFVSIPSRGLRSYILGSDFRAFYGAGEMVIHGIHQIYDPKVQLFWQKSFMPDFPGLTDLNPFRNPSFYALLFVPLTILPFESAYFVFWVFNFLLLGLDIYLVLLLLPKLNHYYKACITLMILSYPPVVEVLALAQSSFFLLLALLLTRIFLLKKRYLLAGFALSLLFLKLQYLPPAILFLVIKRYFKILI